MPSLADPTRTLDHFVEQAGRLYSLPGVALQVMELTARPTVDTYALKQCIELDPALTSKILRVVNSSLFGLSRQVSDLNQALALLGTKPLKLLVLGFSLPDTLTENLTGDMLGRYWWSVLNKAVAARELSETFWHQPGDEAFIAGLLQDLGMLVLIQAVGDPYVRFLEHVFAGGGNLAALEIATFGFNHFQLGARLLEQWGLPANIVKAVAQGGAAAAAMDPDRHNSLPEILRWAELIAELLTQRSEALPELVGLIENGGRLTRDDLALLIQNLQTKVEHLAGAMALQLPHGEAYQALIAQAQRQLATASDEFLLDLAQAAQNSVLNDTEALARWGEAMQMTSALMKFAQRAGSKGGTKADRESRPRAVSATPDPLAPLPEEFDSSRAAPRRVLVSASSGGFVDSLSPAEFTRQVEDAVCLCRQARAPLSLIIATLDDFSDWSARRDSQTAQQTGRTFQMLCRRLDHPRVLALPLRPGCAAILLLDCERARAIELTNQLLRAAERLSPADSAAEGTLRANAGIATIDLPAKNFPAADLIRAAERCLQNAETAGGGLLKSIGVY
ncbi:MAG TPA: HDOD domain-containing protein [Pirellulales bacterium]|jgi:HD-like signal output (HDOD) protein/GGDEF domain-containing protein|nr:HDOD domain-containing protein [Pirellulales bacterium]